MSPPKVFTIAAGLPFVDVLATGIQHRAGDDPAALANVTVLVPTQRSRRSLAEAFLRQSGGRALLLPRIIALGDMDEDEILFSGGYGETLDLPGQDEMRVPEAVSGLQRQLLLTKLVLARDDASVAVAAGVGFFAGLALLRAPRSLGPLDRVRSLAIFDALRTTPMGRALNVRQFHGTRRQQGPQTCSAE